MYASRSKLKTVFKVGMTLKVDCVVVDDLPPDTVVVVTLLSGDAVIVVVGIFLLLDVNIAANNKILLVTVINQRS